jgi:hypothetical protein
LALLFFASHAQGERRTPNQHSTSDADITFEKQIRPILKANCFDCHGEGEKLKGNLDLRLRRLMVKGGESGPANEAGKPEKSLLYQKVVEGEMPKREKKLSAQEIEIIRRWIADGAKTAHDEPIEPGKGMGITPDDRAHWSFQTIAKPLLPNFKAKDRVRTAVDAFLLAELSKRKLSFSPDAEKVTLVRRAYFDLVGFPRRPKRSPLWRTNLEARTAYRRPAEHSSVRRALGPALARRGGLRRFRRLRGRRHAAHLRL